MVGRVGGGAEHSAEQRVGDPDGRIFLVALNSYGPSSPPTAEWACYPAWMHQELCPHVEWSDLPPPSPSKWSFPSRAVESFSGISLKPCLEWQKSQWWVRAPGISGDP